MKKFNLKRKKTEIEIMAEHVSFCIEAEGNHKHILFVLKVLHGSETYSKDIHLYSFYVVKVCEPGWPALPHNNCFIKFLGNMHTLRTSDPFFFDFPACQPNNGSTSHSQVEVLVSAVFHLFKNSSWKKMNKTVVE